MATLSLNRPMICASRSLFLACFLLVIIFTTLEGTRRLQIHSFDTAQSPHSSAVESVHDQPKEARVLSAHDLLVRPLATNLTTVPKIFHQSWSTSTLPVKFENWSRSCREVCSKSLFPNECNPRLVSRLSLAVLLPSRPFSEH